MLYGGRARVVSDGFIDGLLQGYKQLSGLLGESGILVELKRVLVETALGAGYTRHLRCGNGSKRDAKRGCTRNSRGKKRVKSSGNEMGLSVPRYRDGGFEPQLIKNGQRRFDGFADKIISMYARGMSVREIQAHIKELYAVQVSPDLISRVTSAVMGEVVEWQILPLDPVCPVVIFDTLLI